LNAAPYLALKVANQGLAKKGLARYVSAEQWTVQIKLSAGGKSDEYNLIGVHPLAKSGSDTLDRAEPPQGFGELVTLSFGSTHAPLSRDIKASKTALRWTINLNSSADRMGSVVFDGLQGQRLVWIHNGEVKEIHSGVPIAVALRKHGSVAYVEEMGNRNELALQGGITGFRASYTQGAVNVSFEVPVALSGKNAVVDYRSANGARLSTHALGAVYSGPQTFTLDGRNLHSGLTWIRLRIGNQSIAKPLVVAK
jgi:hypothetical protein